MLLLPVIAEGAQHLSALGLGQDTSERAVLPQLAGSLIHADDDSGDDIDAIVDYLLPLVEVTHGHTIRAMHGPPTGDVALRRLQHTTRVDHESTEQRSMEPE